MSLYYSIYADGESKYTHAHVVGVDYDSEELIRGKPVSNWVGNQVFRIFNEKHPHTQCEDVPWMSPWHGEMLASRRLCELIHQADPNCAEFLPIICKFDQEYNLGEDAYSMVNWLYVVDATDYHRTEFREDKNLGYKYIYITM